MADISIAIPPAGYDLRFVDDSGVLLFEPLSDITALEAVRLSALFAMGAVSGCPKWRDYLHKYALLRHFT